MATKPTHEQGQLHLQVYDLRREARLRQARDWFAKNYIVDTLEDSMRIAAPGTENGASVTAKRCLTAHRCSWHSAPRWAQALPLGSHVGAQQCSEVRPT